MTLWVCESVFADSKSEEMPPKTNMEENMIILHINYFLTVFHVLKMRYAVNASMCDEAKNLMLASPTHYGSV